MEEKLEDIYFAYKDFPISLKEVGKSSKNPIIQEFNSIYEELNLKYSFSKLSSLSDNFFGESPIYLHYKEQKMTLTDFVSENNEMAKELILLPGIAGLEVQHTFNLLIQQIESKKIQEDSVAICIETFRLLQDLYNTFAMARYSLLQGYQKIHSYNIIKWDSGTYGQYWIRAINVNNSIVWYNSCFDILLQTLWIGKKYFLQNSKSNFIDIYNLKQYETILHKCRLEVFPENSDKKILKDFMETEPFKGLRSKANALKHRHSLRYYELSPKNLIAFLSADDKGYSSTKTLSFFSIDDTIIDLIKFHKIFIPLVVEIKKILAQEFLKYGISI